MAAVDGTVGRKATWPIADMFSRQKDITNAFDCWAGRRRERVGGATGKVAGSLSK